MRDRLWYNLQNAKFKAEYLSQISKRSYTWGNAYSFFLAFASASSVAAWSIWNTMPTIWTSVVALSQLLHIAKPYLPFLRYEREFLEMGLLYDNIYLEYEKLWFQYEKEKINEDVTEKLFYQLKNNEIQGINTRFKHVHCPDFERVKRKASAEVAKELSLTFKGDYYAE